MWETKTKRKLITEREKREKEEEEINDSSRRLRCSGMVSGSSSAFRIDKIKVVREVERKGKV